MSIPFNDTPPAVEQICEQLALRTGLQVECKIGLEMVPVELRSMRIAFPNDCIEGIFLLNEIETSIYFSLFPDRFEFSFYRFKHIHWFLVAGLVDLGGVFPFPIAIPEFVNQVWDHQRTEAYYNPIKLP